MSQFSYTSQTTSPNATAYDAAYPTRSQELYANECHNLLKLMAQNGFVFHDDNINGSQWTALQSRLFDVIKQVREYAALAITTYRSTGTPTCAVPALGSPLSYPYICGYPEANRVMLEVWWRANAACQAIYYMWKSAEDPILLQEKIQEVLLAWPLLDTTIELTDEGGSALRVYPTVKNVDV